MRTFKVALLFVGLFLFVSPVFAQSSTTQAQIDALLAQIRVLQERLAQMQGSMSLKGCVDLSYNLYADRTDAQTGGEVSKLQMFLAQTPHIYPSGLITGYFGPATEVAVQKWQAAAGVVSSGSPETTGYGYVGPKTRSLMSCGSPIPQTIPPVVTTPPIGVSESCTITASKTSVGVGESYTISWTTRNIDDPVMYEEVKAGGTVEINKRGSKEFTTPYVGTDTYQIGAGGLSAPYRPLCSVSVTASDDAVAEIGEVDISDSRALEGEIVEFEWSIKNPAGSVKIVLREYGRADIPVYRGSAQERGQYNWSATLPSGRSVFGGSAYLELYNEMGQKIEEEHISALAINKSSDGRDPDVTVISPDSDLSVGRGGQFYIKWKTDDVDPMDYIGFSLVGSGGEYPAGGGYYAINGTTDYGTVQQNVPNGSYRVRVYAYQISCMPPEYAQRSYEEKSDFSRMTMCQDSQYGYGDSEGMITVSQ